MNFFIVALCVCFAAADVSHLDSKDREAPILKQEQDVSFDGNYNWQFETGNGIAQSAQGSLQNAQGENPAQVVQGQASWQAPDGQQIAFTYTADAEGYHPSGDILPTPPPIPEEILKALEYIRTHPPKESEPSTN